MCADDKPHIKQKQSTETVVYNYAYIYVRVYITMYTHADSYAEARSAGPAALAIQELSIDP